MAKTKANLLAGTYTLYLAPVGEALPELDDLEPPAITIGAPGGSWSEVGYTLQDQELKATIGKQAVRVNEHNPVLKRFPTEEDGSLKIVLAENDLTRYRYLNSGATLSTVAAGADQVAQDIVGFGDKVAAARWAGLFVGVTPEGGSRVIAVWDMEQEGDAVAVFSKEHKGWEVTFLMNVDEAQAVGDRLFKIIDITAAASS